MLTGDSERFRNHGRHFGTPTVNLMLQKSRADLEFWATSCRSKELFLQTEINAGNSKDPEKTQEVVGAMQEKYQAIRKFLMDFPDHTDPMHPLEVTKLFEKHGIMRNYGALNSYFTPRMQEGTGIFPSTPKEMQEENRVPIYLAGPNGKRGYPTKPGEKTQDGFLVMASSAFKPSGIPKRKHPFESVQQEMEDLRKMKEGLPEHGANSFLASTIRSSQQAEETPPLSSSLQESDTEDTLLISDSPEKEESSPKKPRYNLRPRKE